MRLNYFKGARFGGHLFPVVLLGGWLPAAHAEQRVYFLTEALARSETNAITDAVRGWHGTYGPGRGQYGWSWLEMGVRGEQWGFGAVCRWDYDFRFTPDTAELYGAIQNDQPLAVGRRYDVDLKAHAVHATGVRVSWRDRLPGNLQAEFGCSLLKGNYLMEGSLRGAATATAPKDYDYSAWVDYAYTKDVLFEREVAPLSGYGFALDADLDWRFHPDWRLEMQARDIAGCLWWMNLPYTQANAFSARSHTDREGFKHWDPLVSGREANHQSYRQDLPTRGKVDLLYSGWQMTPAVGLTYQFGDWLPRVGLGQAQNEWSLFAWYWTKDHAIGLEASRRSWKLGVTMSALRWVKTRMIDLNVSHAY